MRELASVIALLYLSYAESQAGGELYHTDNVDKHMYRRSTARLEAIAYIWPRVLTGQLITRL